MVAPDVSVVVVHGTGTQERGDTVTEWTEGLLRFTDIQGRRGYPAEVTELVVGEDAESEATVGDPSDVEVVGLAADRHPVPGDVGLREDADREPAAATLTIGGPGSGDAVVVEDPAVRLRIVEAHWAEAFEPPGAGDVLRWLLWFAPSFAVTQMVLEARAAGWGPAEGSDEGRAADADRGRQNDRAARARESPVRPGARQGPARPGARRMARVMGRAQEGVRQLRPFAPLYSMAVGLALLAVLGPALLVAFLVLVVSAAIPSGRVRNAVAVVLTYLSQNVGDVQSFLIRPVARARMEARVADAISAEVRERGARRVHVLAVSQGAALAHGVLLRLPAELRPERLTTVGGAHGRLHDIRVLTPPAWTRVPIVVTGLAWLLAVPLIGALGGVLAAAIVLGVSAASILALAFSAARNVDAYAARHESEAPTAELPSPGTIAGVQWLDMWAPFDAVPNGRPVAPPEEGYRFVTVPGEMHVLDDHVSYRKDWTESVPRILHHITGHLPERRQLGAPRGVRARTPLDDPEGTGSNWTPWAPRDWVAFALRVLPLTAAVVAALTPARSYYRGIGVAVRELHSVLGGLVDGLHAMVDRGLALFGPTEVSAAGTVELVLGFAVVLATATVLGRVTAALFRTATRVEGATWARSLDFPPVQRWSVARWTVVGGAIVVAWGGMVVVGLVLIGIVGR